MFAQKKIQLKARYLNANSLVFKSHQFKTRGTIDFKSFDISKDLYLCKSFIEKKVLKGSKWSKFKNNTDNHIYDRICIFSKKIYT